MKTIILVLYLSEAETHQSFYETNLLVSKEFLCADMLSDLRKPVPGKNLTSSSILHTSRRPIKPIEPSIAVLVIACNRVDYVKQTLDELLKWAFNYDSSVVYWPCVFRHRPSAGLFPIIVSQDCGHQQTADAIANYGARITHIKVSSLLQCHVQWTS